MYTMLTALGVLVGYLIIHGEASIRYRGLHWSAYVLVATAAIYTHYFAFFLLVALAVAYLADQFFLLPRSQAAEAHPDADLPSTIMRRPIAGFLLANLAVLLLYTPWFAALLTRLAVDASYWEGEFKLGEALRHLAISFTSGETVLEQEATRLLLPYAILTGLSLIALTLRRSVQPRTILYATLWLLAPILAVMLLASIVPKFNPRYVMIALPGLLILWSAGLTALLRLRAWTLPSILASPFRSLPSLVSLLLVALLLIGFAYANRNWFFDPAFTKSEWRQLSQYVRSRIHAAQGNATDDNSLVVLVSGHAWPIWDYYAPDLPPLRLPELEILDVNAVLDINASAGPLHEALQGRSDVWLVQWQDEIVDPMGVVPLQLEVAGEEEETGEKFWQVDLRHYTEVDADKIIDDPTGLLSTSVNFGNQVYLVDYQVADNGDLLLYWRLHPDPAPPLADLHSTGQTFTSDGLPFARLPDSRLVGYEYPTFRWQPDQVNLGRIPAASWAGLGALPGDFRVRIVVYDATGDLTGLDMIGPQGQPQGKQYTLDITLPVATRGPDEMDEVTFAQVLPDLFVELLLSGEQAEPGQAFAAELYWYAEEKPPTDFDLRLRWRLRATDEVVGEQTIRLSPDLPTSQWPDDELLHTVHSLRPPLNLPADDYWLEVGLTAPGSEPVRVPFRVLGSSRIFSIPAYVTPVDAVFGDLLHLAGIIEPVQTTLPAGEQVVLTLVWQALEAGSVDYTATVQWLGEDARPAVQADLLLPGGSANWVAGQVELQTVITAAPSQPGNYRLVIAVYDANQPDFPRLLTADGSDLVDLGIITIQP